MCDGAMNIGGMIGLMTKRLRTAHIIWHLYRLADWYRPKETVEEANADAHPFR
jgi:hypothetical protein